MYLVESKPQWKVGDWLHFRNFWESLEHSKVIVLCTTKGVESETGNYYVLSCLSAVKNKTDYSNPLALQAGTLVWKQKGWLSRPLFHLHYIMCRGLITLHTFSRTLISFSMVSISWCDMKTCNHGPWEASGCCSSANAPCYMNENKWTITITKVESYHSHGVETELNYS